MASAARRTGLSGGQARLAPRSAVRRVAEERVAGLGEVDPDLVRPAGVQRHVHERRTRPRIRSAPRKRLEGPPRGDGAPRVGPARRVTGPVAPVAAVRRVEPPLRRERAVAERDVRLLDRAALPLRLEGGERRLGPRDDEAPRGLPVEPVNEPEPRQRGPRAEPVQERVHHRRVRRAARRVDDHPGRLVEDDEVPVLVEDRQREVLRDRPGRLRRRHLDLERVPGAQPHRGLRRPARDARVARLDEPLHARAREVGGEPRERDVEARAGELGGTVYERRRGPLTRSSTSRAPST